MKLQILIFLAFTIFSLNELSQAQTKVFSEAKGKPILGRIYDFEKWNFSIGNQKYEIKNNGQGKRTIGKNQTANFRFLLDKMKLSKEQFILQSIKTTC